MALLKQKLLARSTHDKDERWRKREMKRIHRQMVFIKNQMDFIEILTNFWPLDNMESRARRLAREMDQLSHKRSLLAH